jgi:hypothetical protein
VCGSVIGQRTSILVRPISFGQIRRIAVTVVRTNPRPPGESWRGRVPLTRLPPPGVPVPPPSRVFASQSVVRD